MNLDTLRRALPALLLLLLCTPALPAQEILTAESFFDEVSERYGKLQDYSARVSITKGQEVMKGRLSYKTPNMLRIDFTDPAEQVLVSDGEELTVYIPRYEVILLQKLKRRSQAALANLVSAQGLTLLKKSYSVAYLIGQDWVPLEEGSREMVKKLGLSSRSTSEGFRKGGVAGGGAGGGGGL